MHNSNDYDPEAKDTYQLWRSDLTTINTKSVMSIFPGTSFPYSQNLENVNNNLYSLVNPESVKFVLNGGSYRVENVVPFTLAGDNSGDYYVCLPWY